MKRRWLVLAGVIGLLLIAPVLMAEGLYRHGLGMLDGLPSPPPADGLSEALVQVTWAEFEGPGPIAVQRTGPLRHAINMVISRPGRLATAPGLRLASFCARDIVLDRTVGQRGMGAYHLTNASLSIWLSRNWSTEEIIACTLNGGYYGQDRMGIEAAASGYFGRPAADLVHDEVALLMVASRAPSRFERHCDPSALRDDIGELLSLLQLEAASDDRNQMITRRLSDEVWFNGPIRCVRPSDIVGHD